VCPGLGVLVALVRPTIVAGVGLQSRQHRGLELERDVVDVEMVGIGGGEDPGQADQVMVFIPARLTTLEVGTEGQTVLFGDLAHDLQGHETVPVLAAVAGHWSHPISSSVRRSDWSA
jgi:hypothetical protein